MAFTLGPCKYTGFHVDVCERIVADIAKAVQREKLTVNYQLVTPHLKVKLPASALPHAA